MLYCPYCYLVHGVDGVLLNLVSGDGEFHCGEDQAEGSNGSMQEADIYEFFMKKFSLKNNLI
jgi:hypothetical protein